MEEEEPLLHRRYCLLGGVQNVVSLIMVCLLYNSFLSAVFCFAEQKLDACADQAYGFCTNGDDEIDEYGVTLTYDQHQMASPAAGPNGYEVQQDGVCDFMIETNVGSSNDFISPSSTGEQQLRVNVDHYPANVGKYGTKGILIFVAASVQ